MKRLNRRRGEARPEAHKQVLQFKTRQFWVAPTVDAGDGGELIAG